MHITLAWRIVIATGQVATILPFGAIHPSAIDTVQVYLCILMLKSWVISFFLLLHALNRAFLSIPSVVELFNVWFKLYWYLSFHFPCGHFICCVQSSWHRSHIAMCSKWHLNTWQILFFTFEWNTVLTDPIYMSMKIVKIIMAIRNLTIRIEW